MTDAPPPEALELLRERSAARDARDWAAADELRDRLHDLGWEVQDLPRRSTLRPLLPVAAASVGYARPDDLASLLDEPAAVDASVQVVAEDHPGDLERFLAGLAAHPPSIPHELIVVANAPSFDLDEVLARVRLAGEPTVLGSTARLGWADSRNLGLRRSLGQITVVIDTHLEPAGDFLAPLVGTFADDSVGIAGGWGLTSTDARQFSDAPPGEVDAVEGYCLAIRREALRAVGGFEPRFRFYRNADLDLSFAIRDAGWRAVRTDALPLERHQHRAYASLPEAERDRLSKRNFYRFLKRWGDRRDLLLHPDER